MKIVISKLLGAEGAEIMSYWYEASSSQDYSVLSCAHLHPDSLTLAMARWVIAEGP